MFKSYKTRMEVITAAGTLARKLKQPVGFIYDLNCAAWILVPALDLDTYHSDFKARLVMQNGSLWQAA